ncbi:MAG: hypothetical protein HPY70_11595 [Firmicutes bacterium]|nr:hypothetical protein [Bacillota bacterium]
MGLLKPRSIKQQLVMILILVMVGPVISVWLNLFFAEQVDTAIFDEKKAELDKIMLQLLDKIKAEGLDRRENLTDREMTVIRFQEAVKPLLADNPSVKIGYDIPHLKTVIAVSADPHNKNLIRINIIEDERVAHMEPINKIGSMRRRDLVRKPLPVITEGGLTGILWVEDRIPTDFFKFMSIRYFSFIITGISLIGGIIGTTILIKNILKDINIIKNGIGKLKNNLGSRIPRISGELDQVAETINQMAFELEEKKKLEEQLHRSERLAALGQLVSGIAHELRNPLGIIRATVQIMEKSVKEKKEVEEYTSIIKEQVDRQNRIIKELLDFARPSPPRMEPVNLNALLDSVLTFTGGYAKNKGVDLITEKQDNLPPVMADGEKIKQVMVNLILNGIQAIEKKGEMVIKTYTRGDKVIAEFTDTGPGIPREHLENIFNPFFTTKDTGTGLGLAISYQIMKMHHGAIEVESSEGKGSTFRMTLPALIQMEGEKDV